MVSANRSSRDIADVLQAVGIARVFTVDLHTLQVEGFFYIPVDSLTAVPTLCRALCDYLPSDVVVVSPDSGASAWPLITRSASAPAHRTAQAARERLRNESDPCCRDELAESHAGAPACHAVAGEHDRLARIDALGIPVVQTFMGKGSLPETHPLCLGTVGLQEHDYVSCGLDRADVVLCVGYDLVEYAPARWNACHDKRIVHIDPSPAEVDAAYQVVVGVQGSIAESLTRIAERASARGEVRAIRGVGELREIIQKEFRAEARENHFR